jgi:exodeoxyribonuclease V beta subunit
MKIFHPINTPLAGANLIEASAGTGKTYTITGLYIRLIIEESLTVDKILVVTFTKAATEELKERIRHRLIQAKKAFTSGWSDDFFINELVEKHKDSVLVEQRIQNAIFDFDNAAIFTIHGFCQRILNENAFETRSLFDTELVSGQDAFLQEAADDFWREHFYRMPDEFVSFAVNKITGPEYFVRLLTKKKTPDIKVIPELKKPTLTSLDDFRSIYKRLKKSWSVSRDRVMSADGGLKDPSLSGSIYGSIKTKAKQAAASKRDMAISSLAEAMDRFTDIKSIGFPLFKGFEKFTATKLAQATRKNYITSSHEFFDVCEALFEKSSDLEAEMETYLLYLKAKCITSTHSRLSVRKKNSNILFFDDLLIQVRNAIVHGDGNDLATVIRQRYKAALVDEFQDTDSIQYEIFIRLFASRPNILFFIGDPKQAIYGFRGADIFSYIKAVQNVSAKYTLIENWRSNPSLISAINTVFTRVDEPFVFEQIRFEEGTSGEKKEPLDHETSPSLTLWYVDAHKSPTASKYMRKSEAVTLIAKAVAGEITRLIYPNQNSSYDPESGRVKAGDIAVLVRTNKQAHVVRQCLAAKHIPSVLYNTGNVFHTKEALELKRILLSISDPSNKRLFRSALVTDMIGVTGKELDSEGQEPLWWEPRHEHFREYYQLWHSYGFIRMFRQFMIDEKVRARLLSFPDGERRLTNVLHLAELLHKESVETNSGMVGLVNWMSEQRKAEYTESEAHHLRLESDRHAVKIITIHKSKGLEFPIVFCPYAWDGSIIKDKDVLFHNNDRNKALTLDMGSDDINLHLDIAQNERLAENLRLLYVALTRAIKRCYLVWGRINTAETSALAYLFHYHIDQEHLVDKKNLVSSLKNFFLTLKEEDFLKDLKQLVAQSQGTIELVPVPFDNGGQYSIPERKKEEVVLKQFNGEIDHTWKISSYSYLISQQTFEEAIPDRDAYQDIHRHHLENESGMYEKTDILSFPKGTKAGIFFHDIFEHIDFAPGNFESTESLVMNKLKAYGFEDKWQEPVCSMIKKVLSLPLHIDAMPITLSSIPAKDRINEMEFHFPLNPIHPRQLEKIFSIYGGINLPVGFSEKIGRLTFPLSKGYMKGFLDLVFLAGDRYYIVDWKSNFLGNHLQDYSKAKLNGIMNNNYYILQYYLYSLALHQHLRLRRPDYRYDADFGGVFYIFIRGVEPDQGPEFGMYKDLPIFELIHSLGKALIPNY